MTAAQAQAIADSMAQSLRAMNETLDELHERQIQLAADEKRLRARIADASKAHDRFVVQQEALGIL